MAKRKTNGGRPKRPPPKAKMNGDADLETHLEQLEIEIEMSSGYTVVIHRPPFSLLQALEDRAQELYPDPEMPTETVVLNEGASDETTKETPVLSGTPEHDAYTKAQVKVLNQRGEYTKDYLFQKRLTVKGYESADGRKKLVQLHKDDLEELREFGKVKDDLEDYQLVMRNFVVYTMSDHQMVMAVCSGMTEAMNLKPEEILRRARQFQRPVEWQADPGSESHRIQPGNEVD